MEKSEPDVAKADMTTCSPSDPGKPSPTPEIDPQKPSDEELHVDEHSENEATADLPEGSLEDIVGFSIGQQQIRMKSPDTPAFEKIQALDRSKDYFDLESDAFDANNKGPGPNNFTDQHDPSTARLSRAVNRFNGYDGQLSSSEASAVNNSRTSTSRAILREGFDSPTRRASLGSTSMVDTLRKILPDIPSISFAKDGPAHLYSLTQKSGGDDQVNKRARSSTLFSRGRLPWVSSIQLPEFANFSTRTTEAPMRQSTAIDKDVNNPKAAVQARRSTADQWDGSHQVKPDLPRLRRTTSDNSLFLRNDLERATTQDDAEKWGSVSEQLNSRFKAITDSIQDSAITRMPRIPSISLGPFKPGPLRSNSEAARQNLSRNVGMGPPHNESDSRGQQYSIILPSETKKHAHPILNQAISELSGDVVVLGGYRGSILRSATPPHKQVWVPVKVS